MAAFATLYLGWPPRCTLCLPRLDWQPMPIFDGAANDAHRMAFEMGQADQHVRCCNRLGNVGLFNRYPVGMSTR